MLKRTNALKAFLNPFSGFGFFQLEVSTSSGRSRFYRTSLKTSGYKKPSPPMQADLSSLFLCCGALSQGAPVVKLLSLVFFVSFVVQSFLSFVLCYFASLR
jgi:hypothetical protein